MRLINENMMEAFLAAAEEWVCDGYALDVRYFAQLGTGPANLWSAEIRLNPLPPPVDFQMRVETTQFAFGQLHASSQSREDLLRFLRQAAGGNLSDSRIGPLILPANQDLDYYSSMVARDQWSSLLNLQIFGERRPPPSAFELARADNELRMTSPPFDGLADVTNSLGLTPVGSAPPAISMHVGPPVDLMTNATESALSDGILRLTLHAHPNFDVSRVGLALRVVPGNGLAARLQVVNQIKWDDAKGDRRVGTAAIKVEHGDSTLTMLTLGGALIRRQWFIDPVKARNVRMLAMQHFDIDFRMLRTALFEVQDSVKFEKSVSAVLFMLGFNPALQIETDAPDLVVATPGGRLVLVECSTKTNDFSSKVGKLVDRRASLGKSLAGSGHPSEVAAVLVCRLPAEQLAPQGTHARDHNVILITREDIEAALRRIRFVSDPDALLATAMSSAQGGLFGTNDGV